MMQHRRSDKLTPSSRNCVIFFFRCDRRDRRFRSCCFVMTVATFAKYFLRTWPHTHRELTSAELAVRTWQTVSSGFFPPLLLAGLREEQLGYRGHDQVALQALVVADFKVTQAQETN